WVKTERAASRADKRQVKAVETIVAKARTKDRLPAFSKLVTNDDGEMRIIADPPLIVPLEDVVTDAHEIRNTEETMRGILASYRSTLLVARHPLEEYRYVHMARKVVGVGSVGTRA